MCRSYLSNSFGLHDFKRFVDVLFLGKGKVKSPEKPRNPLAPEPGPLQESIHPGVTASTKKQDSLLPLDEKPLLSHRSLHFAGGCHRGREALGGLYFDTFCPSFPDACSGCFGKRREDVDRYPGVRAKEVPEPPDVVVVLMGDDHRGNGAGVNAQKLHVLEEQRTTFPGVEEDVFLPLHKTGKTVGGKERRGERCVVIEYGELHHILPETHLNLYSCGSHGRFRCGRERQVL